MKWEGGNALRGYISWSPSEDGEGLSIPEEVKVSIVTGFCEVGWCHRKRTLGPWMLRAKICGSH